MPIKYFSVIINSMVWDDNADIVVNEPRNPVTIKKLKFDLVSINAIQIPMQKQPIIFTKNVPNETFNIWIESNKSPK